MTGETCTACSNSLCRPSFFRPGPHFSGRRIATVSSAPCGQSGPFVQPCRLERARGTGLAKVCPLALTSNMTWLLMHRRRAFGLSMSLLAPARQSPKRDLNANAYQEEGPCRHGKHLPFSRGRQGTRISALRIVRGKSPGKSGAERLGHSCGASADSLGCFAWLLGRSK